MTASLRTFARVSSWVTITAFVATSGARAQAPTVFNACITALTGILYVPKEAGKCFLTIHIPISWTDGAGALRNGAAAGGDLSGSYPNPTVGKLQGRAVASTAPADKQVLAYDAASSSWTPAPAPSGGVTAHSALTGLTNDDHPQYLMTDGTRALTGTMSMGGFKLTGLAAATSTGEAVRYDEAVKTGDAAEGDLSGTYPNPTIGANAVSGDKIANGQVVRSINGLKDAVALAAGNGVTISPSGQTLTISVAASAAPLVLHYLSSFGAAAAGRSVDQILQCPSGEIATGGGVRVGRDLQITVSAPVAAGFGWEVQVLNTSNLDQSFTEYVVCVSGHPT